MAAAGIFPLSGYRGSKIVQNREKLAAKLLPYAEVHTPITNPPDPLIEFSPIVGDRISTTEDSPPSSNCFKEDLDRENSIIDHGITKLSIQLSQVKNKRICKFSPYEYLRHLSVLRFLEQTHERGKSDEEASLDIAEMLWEHKDKNGPKQHPRNSLLRKARHIQDWTQEYLETGELEEHKHGTHKKTESPLARREVMEAAKVALGKMTKPTPAALKAALLETILPQLQVENPKVSETTCRSYMQQWGWTKGAYKQQWIDTKKPLNAPVKHADDGRYQNEETSVLNSPATPTPKKPAPWHAPIPSPTTAIRTAVVSEPAILTEPTIQRVSPSLPTPSITPAGIVFENPPSNPQRSSIYWPDMQSYATQQARMYPVPESDRSSEPVQYGNSVSVRFLSQSGPYIPKSLDGIVPDPPIMMGIRPRFNGEPVATFVPPPSMMQDYMHGGTFPESTFPSQQINRRHSSYNPNTQSTHFNPSSQLPYMPDME